MEVIYPPMQVILLIKEFAAKIRLYKADQKEV